MFGVRGLRGAVGVHLGAILGDEVRGGGARLLVLVLVLVLLERRKLRCGVCGAAARLLLGRSLVAGGGGGGLVGDGAFGGVARFV